MLLRTWRGRCLLELVLLLHLDVFLEVELLHHMNKLKNKNHMIILIVAENVSDKIQHSFMIKTLQKVGKEGTYLNIIIRPYMTKLQVTYSMMKS